MIKELEINKFDEDGNKHGHWIEYFDTGEKMFEGKYNHGQRDGWCKDYFIWHTLIEEGEYKDGVRNGMFLGYAGIGSLSSETIYVNGKRHGEFKDYWTFTGQIMEHCIFKDDLRSGISKIHDHHGVLEREELYII